MLGCCARGIFGLGVLYLGQALFPGVLRMTATITPDARYPVNLDVVRLLPTVFMGVVLVVSSWLSLGTLTNYRQKRRAD